MKMAATVVGVFQALGDTIENAILNGEVEGLNERVPQLLVAILCLQNDGEMLEVLTKLFDLSRQSKADPANVEKVKKALRKFRNFSLSVKIGTEVKEIHRFF